MSLLSSLRDQVLSHLFPYARLWQEKWYRKLCTIWAVAIVTCVLLGSVNLLEGLSLAKGLSVLIFSFILVMGIVSAVALVVKHRSGEMLIVGVEMLLGLVFAWRWIQIAFANSVTTFPL